MRRDDVIDEEDNESVELDEQALAADVRRKVLAALPRVLAQLDRVVLGGHKFESDAARHACVALLRLAPRLIARADPLARDDGCLGYHPSHTPERAAELLRRIRKSETRGDVEDANCKRSRRMSHER